MGSILAGHRAGGRMRPALFRWDGSAAFQVTMRAICRYRRRWRSTYRALGVGERSVSGAVNLTTLISRGSFLTQNNFFCHLPLCYIFSAL